MPNLLNNWIDSRIEKMLSDKTLNTYQDIITLVDEDYIKQRNRVFYDADTMEIYRFFKIRKPRNRLIDTNIFYTVVNGNIPLLHYPLANIISKTMANLIFSNSPHIAANCGNKGKDKYYNEILNKTFDENNIKELLHKACEYESYSGSVGFKPVIDKEFSDYPIFIPYPAENMDVIKKYGRVTDVIFKDTFNKNKDEYTLFTICGKGYIRYKLFKNVTSNTKTVPLTEIEETAGLRDIEFFTKDGKRYNRLMAIYKENKTDGKSDYANLADDFAALDEIYSNMMDYVRKSRIKMYMPESLMKQDLDTGEKYVKSEYDTSYISLFDSNPAGTNVKAERDVVDVNSSLQGYREAFNSVMMNALSTAGLSPCSVGIDSAGANSSALALNIRERVSLRTREEKQSKWKEALVDFVRLILDLSSVNAIGDRTFIDFYDKDVDIIFAEYETPTFAEQVETLGNALDKHLISMSEALAQLYPDKTEEEIEIMMIEIDGQLPDSKKIEDDELDKEDEEEQKDE